jgi:ATP-dependent DNA helicase RecQ
MPQLGTDVLSVLKKFWGYESFRPLQEEAIRSVLDQRDSLVVLPTGGGKSLCFQAPALVMEGLAVVVSPLIALMKDQVDALKACGVSAVCLNSASSESDRYEAAKGMRDGTLKLLYAAPERVVTESFLQTLAKTPISFFAIDEAHCISNWGHDFRPEYRALRVLREAFPDAAVHAYTATATEQVRADIVEQLGLRNPEVLVGSFDRPNLLLKAVKRHNRLGQILEVIGRYSRESGIIYCISRKEVENLSATLQTSGYKALPYHAGMSDDDRNHNQEAFAREEADIIVATVAFGMGIDKSNVRYVVHSGMPKSLEHYQQEAGRAGRDGLEAECCLLYSEGDVVIWRKRLSDLSPDQRKIAFAKLDELQDYCVGMECRHRAVVRYFGQDLGKENCGACDICLGSFEPVKDSLVLAQKILSCVARLNERFSASYTVRVLKGSAEKRILANGHEKLSTYGLLRETSRIELSSFIEQLVRRGFLEETGPYDDLHLTPKGRLVLAGKETPTLVKPIEDEEISTSSRRQGIESWEGVDRGLFEVLRDLRRRNAEALGVSPFVIFLDAALREMARVRPSTQEGFLAIAGVGEKKSKDHGQEFVRAIVEYCGQAGIPMDQKGSRTGAERGPAQPNRILNEAVRKAFHLFRQGKTLEEVAKETNRAVSTTSDYLAEFIQAEGISEPMPWISAGVFARIRDAAQQTGMERMKPIYEHLGGEISYNEIRIGLACLRNAAA